MSTIKEEFIKQMINLACCKTSPKEWTFWWKDNSEQLELFLNRGEYLRIKPCEHEFSWLPILKSQKGAIKYLDDNAIVYIKENTYQENYEKELLSYSKKVKELDNTLLAELKVKSSQLFVRYPKFANSLKYNFSADDVIKTGISIKEIMEFENLSGVKMPTDMLVFFQTVSQISIEGIKINFAEIHTIDILGKSYYVFGEYWKEADGDLLLWDVSEDNDRTKIYYYAHEHNSIKMLEKSLEDLIEKEFVNYNKSL